MKVLVTIELDCAVGPGDDKREETREALKHLGEHIVNAAQLSYSKVEAASIGQITGLSKDGAAHVAKPIVLVAPAVEAATSTGAEPVEG